MVGVILEVVPPSEISITNRVEVELMSEDAHGRSPSRVYENLYDQLDTFVCVKLFCDFRTWGLRDSTWDEYEYV